ncbi:MAG: hypothetical protein V3T30_02110, partial [Thermodesulfobacteriota bacterium]
MLDLKFSKESLNSRLAKEEIGEVFEAFAHDLLSPEFPKLRRFGAAGNDGCIDFYYDEGAERLVVQCKHIGTEGGLKDAQNRWKKDADNLEKNIIDSAGPKLSQYQPWYQTDFPISKYLFCISSKLKTLRQIEDLRIEIKDFFAELAGMHPHLSHLRGLAVEVREWNYFLHTQLEQIPFYKFKWFSSIWPRGLMPLGELRHDSESFRKYLDGDNVPYYSRKDHLTSESRPDGAEIEDEERLLSRLEDKNTGLVITGPGGVGKTRLVLELGRLAVKKKRLVFCVTGSAGRASIDRLIEQITQDTRLLLLIDYIELQKNFAEIVEYVNELNDRGVVDIRYIANCRTSYFKTIKKGYERFEGINLAPIGDGSRWNEGFRKNIVRRILDEGEFQVTPELLDLCRDRPVLAVFASYLFHKKGETGLEGLVGERSFGGWVLKRMSLTFDGRKDVDEEIATLAAFIPMEKTVAERLSTDMVGLLTRLAQDGWVEKDGESGRWEAAHDALADEVLRSFIEDHQPTLDIFVKKLFTQARALGTIESVLISFQRLSDRSETDSLNWYDIVNGEITENPDKWLCVRHLLLCTSLLDPVKSVRLLGLHEEYWDGIEKDIEMQLQLSELALQAADGKIEGLGEGERKTLETWVVRGKRHANVSKDILTSTVKFTKDEAVEEVSFSRINEKPRLLQDHALARGERDVFRPIKEGLLWLYGTRFDVEFNNNYWLDAGGEVELLSHYLITWPKAHGMHEAAQRVYKFRHDTNRERELFYDQITAWMKVNEAYEDAQFVYKSWLDAGWERGLVEGHIKAWLKAHDMHLDAG